MDVAPEERAKRNHPVPAQQLVDAITAIVQEKREQDFIAEFSNAFVLASKDDIVRLKAFLVRIGADRNTANMAATRTIGAPRC
jgi:hypothetical protein